MSVAFRRLYCRRLRPWLYSEDEIAVVDAEDAHALAESDSGDYASYSHEQGEQSAWYL